jgi:hypothetical protein
MAYKKRRCDVPPTLPDVFVGPYLDDLGDPYRFLINGTQDYTHFNGGLGETLFLPLAQRTQERFKLNVFHR